MANFTFYPPVTAIPFASKRKGWAGFSQKTAIWAIPGGLSPRRPQMCFYALIPSSSPCGIDNTIQLHYNSKKIPQLDNTFSMIFRTIGIFDLWQLL